VLAQLCFDEASEESFLNMVIYCLKTPGSLSFRLTKNEDFLGSMARRAYLPPNEWLELRVEGVGGSGRGVEQQRCGDEGEHERAGGVSEGGGGEALGNYEDGVAAGGLGDLVDGYFLCVKMNVLHLLF
jgi:hypothetical protein